MPKANKPATATLVATAPVKTAVPAPVIKPSTATSSVTRPTQAKPLEPVPGQLTAKSEQEITLKYVSPTAKEVKIAGNFNGWHPNVTPLKCNGHGEWTVHLTLRSGQYEYRFVVDGHWVEDPQASQRGANPFGGFNSILTVPLAARAPML